MTTPRLDQPPEPPDLHSCHHAVYVAHRRLTALLHGARELLEERLVESQEDDEAFPAVHDAICQLILLAQEQCQSAEDALEQAEIAVLRHPHPTEDA